MSGCLFFTNQGQFIFRSRLCQEVVHAGLFGDSFRRQAVVTGNHHCLDPHSPEAFKTIPQSSFDNVLQMDNAQNALLLCDHQRRPTGAAHNVHLFHDLRRKIFSRKRPDRVRRTLPDLPAVDIHATHTSLSREGDEFRLRHLGNGPAPQAEFLGQDDNTPSFRCFIGKGRQLRRIGQLLWLQASSGQEFRGLTIPQGNGAGFIQQENVYIPRCLYGPTAHSQDILLHQPVDTGNADRTQ